ncbi:hypothetical protein LCGC14_2121180, partial [marine sediment metagenome]
MNWMSYHIGEEFLISFICLGIAWRAFSVSRSLDPSLSDYLELRSRTFLISAGFLILGISSFMHALIHASGWDLNLLYQTLLSYCLGLFLLIIAIASERPWRKTAYPLLYLPLMILLVPGVYQSFPIFGEFRPIVWIAIAYFSGVVSILYISLYYHTRLNRFLFSALGHLFICISAIFLFFPTGIGSSAWIHGHLMRPIGFGILFFSMNSEELLNIKESMLYKTLAAFSLLAAIPLLAFGMILSFDNLHSINIQSRRIAVFFFMLVTFASSMFFGLGLIIRLIRPVIQLKDNVNKIADEGLERRVELNSGDELGELSVAFNNMLAKLEDSFSERDRLSRLAATGELASTLAHEIKNPLNAISGAAVYIRNNFKGDLIKEFVNVIDEEVSRMNKLSMNLLTFAKPLPFNPVNTDINKLVLATADFLGFECEGKDLAILTDLEKEIPEISLDHDQIRQVLINILINSFDAVGHDGEVMIKTSSENGNVAISVHDNGKGIDSAEMAKIFNPFFTTKTRGTGLGLAISKKIMKGHGGDLTV